MINLDDIKVGDKIKLAGFKQRFTVQARNSRYVICTKPYNPQHTVLYTILDLKEGIRNKDNLIFGNGYETREQCEENLKYLEEEVMELSHRGPVDLDIEAIYHV